MLQSLFIWIFYLFKVAAGLTVETNTASILIHLDFLSISVEKKEKIGPFPTEWEIFFDSSYNYYYGADNNNKGMIRINWKQKNPFDGHVATFKGNDIDAMEVLLEDSNRLLLAALIS